MAQFNLENIKKLMLRKYPTFGSTIANVKYVDGSDKVDTAATDGKTIYYNLNFLNNLTEGEQLFAFCHEVCHIAFNHLQRLEGKNLELWNIATDAVINEQLIKDGLTKIEKAIVIKDALKYDAEELYEILKKQQESQNSKYGKNSSDGKDTESDNSEIEVKGKCDNHNLWNQKEDKLDNNNQNKKEQSSKGGGNVEDNKNDKISEKDAFNKNKEEKIKRAKDFIKTLSSRRKSEGVKDNSQIVTLDGIGKTNKNIVNWKRLLATTLTIDDETWGHKFSDHTNNYATRIQDVEYDDKPLTQIILDTSGSVEVDLLKAFLRQVKQILKNSQIQVGTFSDIFHGFQNVKKEKDIDNLKINVSGGTNFNAASLAFSKRKDINKICFTDGCDGNGHANINDKRKDIVWISCVNPNFKPDNGKVIFVSKNEIMNILDNNDDMTR